MTMTRSIDRRSVVALDDVDQLGKAGGKAYVAWHGREYAVSGRDDPARYQPDPDEIIIRGRVTTTLSDGHTHGTIVDLRAIPVPVGTWAAIVAERDAKRRTAERRTATRPVDPLRDHPALRGTRERPGARENGTVRAGPRLTGVDGVMEAAANAGFVLSAVQVGGQYRLRADAGRSKLDLLDAIDSIESLIIGRLLGEPVACAYDNEVAATLLNGRIPACARCAS